MDKNNYELMNLTHIGKSFTALGFNANLKNHMPPGAKTVQAMNGLRRGKPKTMLFQAIIIVLLEAGEEI